MIKGQWVLGIWLLLSSPVIANEIAVQVTREADVEKQTAQVPMMGYFVDRESQIQQDNREGLTTLFRIAPDEYQRQGADVSRQLTRYVYATEYYRQGKLHGPRQVFNDKGVVIEQSNYVDGQLDGAKELFDDNGKLKAKAIYTNGLMTEPFIYYQPDGSLYQGEVIEEDKSTLTTIKANYVDGKRHGPYEERHSLGMPLLKATGEYVDGYPEGVWKKYMQENVNGELVDKVYEETTYNKGIIVQ